MDADGITFVCLLISLNTTVSWDPLKVYYYVNDIQYADKVRCYHNAINVHGGLTLPLVN